MQVKDNTNTWVDLAHLVFQVYYDFAEDVEEGELTGTFVQISLEDFKSVTTLSSGETF